LVILYVNPRVIYFQKLVYGNAVCGSSGEVIFSKLKNPTSDRKNAAVSSPCFF
jgi:hypothetical protein